MGTVEIDLDGNLEFGGKTFLPTPVVYNMVPEHGYPAEFGFNVAGHAILLYAAAIPTPHGYVLQVSSPGILNFIQIDAISLTFWGVPGEASHDAGRGGPSGSQPVRVPDQPRGLLHGPADRDCDVGHLGRPGPLDLGREPRK